MYSSPIDTITGARKNKGSRRRCQLLAPIHPAILPTMVFIPSIDILDGSCVRLLKGDYNEVTQYGDDPVSIGRDFGQKGARRLHVVDLNAARGAGDNRKTISEIRKVFAGVLEVGGGVRRADDVKGLIDIGVDRLIVGTVLARDPDTVAAWVATYGNLLIGGIDSRDGLVKVSGWEEDSGVKDIELAHTAAEIGIISLVFTNIDRDGTLTGPDVAGTERIARESGLPIILSGGISSMDDLENIAKHNTGSIAGVISGKAVYEGKIDIDKALSLYGREITDVPW